MKKIILILLLLFALSGCGGTEPPSIPGRLTITNHAVEMYDARWNGVSFGVIKNGCSVTKEVQPGKKSLYVYLSVVDEWFEVFQSVEVKEGEETIYIFEDTAPGFFVDKPE